MLHIEETKVGAINIVLVSVYLDEIKSNKEVITILSDIRNYSNNTDYVI